MLPADRIAPQWKVLCRELIRFTGPTKKNLLKFKRYFQTYWMQQVGPAGFSVFGLDHKTNNLMESLNARLRKGFKGERKGFWKALDLYKKLTIDWTTRELSGLDNGRIVKRDRRDYKQIAKIISYEKKLISEAWSTEQFLEASSYLFANVPELDEDEEDESDDEDIQIPAPLVVVEVPKCIICDTNPRNALIMPCRDMKCCTACVFEIQASVSPLCPVCLGKIDQVIEPFF